MKNPRNISIEVKGMAGSGKSTIVIEMAKMLQKKGFFVIVREDSEDYLAWSNKEMQKKRLKALKGTAIEIKTIQTKNKY